jgi:hypothetical protein
MLGQMQVHTEVVKKFTRVRGAPISMDQVFGSSKDLSVKVLSTSLRSRGLDHNSLRTLRYFTACSA